MAKPRTVRVMISSRSTSAVTLDDAQQVTLEELRRELKSKLEEVTLFGEQLFEVWIHEDAAADDASLDAWDESLAQIKKADVVLVLYNGEAGWTTPNGTQGICHDEMAAAVDTAPGLVRLIQLPLAPLPRRAAERRRDERFRVYVERQARWRQEANSRDELWAETQVSLRAALDYVVQVGSRAAATGANAYGTSLDWDLLDLAGRRTAMTTQLRMALAAQDGETHGDHGVVVRGLGSGVPVYFRCDAVPAAMGVGAAREMVGQPFLRVRELSEAMAGSAAEAGPVHLIACHKGITENQAMRLLGHPDATIITTPFGVYVADDVMKTQLILIAGCRNPSAVHHGVQRMWTWLEQSEEAGRLVGRAESRYRIVAAIASEDPDNV